MSEAQFDCHEERGCGACITCLTKLLAAAEKESTAKTAAFFALKTHAEALAKALTEALRRLTTAHHRLKDPKMGGEHVGNALAELEKQRAPLHAPLGAYRAEHPEKP